MTPMRTAAAIAAALVVGTFSGALLAGTPDVKAPHECTVALNVASRIFITQSNVVSAVQARATRGQEEFAQHDADVTRLLGELDEMAPVYNDAEADCLGVPR